MALPAVVGVAFDARNPVGPDTEIVKLSVADGTVAYPFASFKLTITEVPADVFAENAESTEGVVVSGVNVIVDATPRVVTVVDAAVVFVTGVPAASVALTSNK